MTTIVSGIPRSGTSLMMQMLSAGGLSPLTDGLRSADANNPRGYYELESVKSLAKDSQIIAQAGDKVIKVVSSLLNYLPNQGTYRVIFMRRPLEEVVASQDRMLERLGKQPDPTPREVVIRAFQRHLKDVESWISQQPHLSVLHVDYPAVLEDPLGEARRISAFLERDLDIEAMARKVEITLHRERITS
jgi:Sulfotransferase domain